MTIVIRIITMMALIIEEKLGLLLLKNSRKIPYSTPISKNFVEQVSEWVILWS